MTPFSANLFGITILEPITLITDSILAGLCLLFFFKISKIAKTSYLAKNWRGFFLWLGLSTFLAGIGHGFMHYTGKWLLIVAWISAGLITYFNQAASIMQVENKKWRRLLMYSILFQLLVVSLLVLFTQKFIFVTINSVVGVAGLVLFIRIRDVILFKNKHSKYVILAICVGFFSAVAHTMQLSVSEWFNYKDIGHVILMISALFFYKGAKGELLEKQRKLVAEKSKPLL